MIKGIRLQQILGVIFLCLIYYILIDKGHHDISILIEENPDNFWPAFIQYIMHNMGARG